MEKEIKDETCLFCGKPCKDNYAGFEIKGKIKQFWAECIKCSITRQFDGKFPDNPNFKQMKDKIDNFLLKKFGTLNWQKIEGMI